jgi:hypothetical protein
MFGLPAHVLLIHFIVVLAPLTALAEIVCAVWPSARHRLVWPVLMLAIVTTALTPLTARAGEWLFDREKDPSDVLRTHAERGGWMMYFAVALLVVAIMLAVLHLLERRAESRRLAVHIGVAIVALAVGVSSIITVVRIGDAGRTSGLGRRIDPIQRTLTLAFAASRQLLLMLLLQEGRAKVELPNSRCRV